MLTVPSVSYTHLDVYKRQILPVTTDNNNPVTRIYYFQTTKFQTAKLIKDKGVKITECVRIFYVRNKQSNLKYSEKRR